MNHSIHDWQYITLSLRTNYKSLNKVGKEVNSDWVHLNRLARGEISEPKHSVGVRLLELHQKHVGNKGLNE